MKSMESLESRRLFAGGIDPSFGSSNGAIFSAPGNVATLTDQTVDAFGRVVLAGYTQPATKPGNRQMFITRLNADGEPDTAFGGFGTGTSVGTPRGLVQIRHIVAIPDGSGYYAVGQLGTKGTSSWRLVKFTSGGRVDASFGKNGVAAVDLDVAALVVQSDGRPIVVGEGGHGELSGFLAVRFLSSGRLDSGYGADGYALVSSRSSDVDEAFSRSVGVSSASIDPGGRLLVSFDNETDFFGSSHDQFSSDLVRLAGNGQRDPKFKGGDVYSDFLAPDDFARPSAAVTRPDGNIAVLIGNRVVIAGARGQLSITDGPNVLLGNLVSQFDVLRAHDSSMVATADNKLIIAGGFIIPASGGHGQTRAGALIRLNADLSLDTSFGDDGVLTLPRNGNLGEADGLMVNPDGTLTSLVRPAEFTQRVDDVPVVRIFQDDRPVASLRSASRKGDQIRLSISVRGVNPIDILSVSADDFRLRAVGPGGSAVPSPLLRTAVGEGDVLLSVLIKRPPATYQVVTLRDTIVDTKDQTVRAGTIATLKI